MFGSYAIFVVVNQVKVIIDNQLRVGIEEQIFTILSNASYFLGTVVTGVVDLVCTVKMVSRFLQQQIDKQKKSIVNSHQSRTNDHSSHENDSIPKTETEKLKLRLWGITWTIIMLDLLAIGVYILGRMFSESAYSHGLVLIANLVPVWHTMCSIHLVGYFYVKMKEANVVTVNNNVESSMPPDFFKAEEGEEMEAIEHWVSHVNNNQVN